jgi:hypothetical protein
MLKLDFIEPVIFLLLFFSIVYIVSLSNNTMKSLKLSHNFQTKHSDLTHQPQN